MKKPKRYALALLLLPICYGMTMALGQSLRSFKDVPEGSFYFFAGIVSYFAFQWACFTPMRTYVFGHELTHAIAAWMSGGKVKGFHVTKRGGHVKVTKSNLFVSLSPYIVPLYSVFLAIISFVACWAYPPIKSYWRALLWMLGASFGFHLALTYYALRQGQPDLKPSGRLLSGVLIYLGNALAITVLLATLFPKTLSWKRIAQTTGEEAYTAVRNVGKGTYIAVSEAINAHERTKT